MNVEKIVGYASTVFFCAPRRAFADKSVIFSVSPPKSLQTILPNRKKYDIIIWNMFCGTPSVPAERKNRKAPPVPRRGGV